MRRGKRAKKKEGERGGTYRLWGKQSIERLA
jgi:hypothetical protein